MYVYRNTVTGILLLCFDSSSHVLLIVIFIMAAVETMWYLYTPMVMNSVYGRKGRTQAQTLPHAAYEGLQAIAIVEHQEALLYSLYLVVRQH